MSSEQVPKGVTVETPRYLAMKPAATYAGVSVSTLRRNKEKLVEAGAFISERGWKVPPSALVKVFNLETLGPSMEAPKEGSDTQYLEPADTSAKDDLIAHLKGEIEFLRAQVSQQSQTIEEQTKAHAVIAAQLSKLEIEAPMQMGEGSNQEPVKKRWWKF